MLMAVSARGERRMLAQRGWLGACPATWPASTRRSLRIETSRQKGRPPARRGRAGGFRWCPGHRGCRVTALVTALRRKIVEPRAVRTLVEEEIPLPAAMAAPVVPRAIQERRLSAAVVSLPRCPVRRRSWLPTCTRQTQQAPCQSREWRDKAASLAIFGMSACSGASCARYMTRAAAAPWWLAARTVVRFPAMC